MSLNVQQNVRRSADVGIFPRLSVVPPPAVVAARPPEGDDFDAAIGAQSRRRTRWEVVYLRNMLALDISIALLAGLFGVLVRFSDPSTPLKLRYVTFAACLPLLWIAVLALNRGYEKRFLYDGSEETRRVFQAGLMLVAGVSFVAFSLQLDFSRGYMLGSFPIVVLGTAVGRYFLRKNLHRRRGSGACMERTIVVGHTRPVVDMMRRLRRQQHHGLDVVAACLPPGVEQVDGLQGTDLPVTRAQDIVTAVEHYRASVVVVLACTEMDGKELRRLSWRLENTGRSSWWHPRWSMSPVHGRP